MGEKIHGETEVPNSFPQVLRVRKHTLRADVTESLGSTDSAPGAHDYFDAALAACKTSVAEYVSTHSNFPPDLNASGCSNQNTQYVNGASANIDNTAFSMSYTTWNIGTPNDCVLTLTAAGYGAGNATISNWNGSHSGCDAKYVPSTFR